MTIHTSYRSAAMALGLAGLAACSPPPQKAAQPPVAAGAPAHSETQKRNLANFDDLDFRVYSGQKWDELHKSHAQDILVHYPDGSTTTGLPDHVERLKPQFVFAPDTVIREHPIKLADGDLTAVQGFMEGTFSQPMDLGNGKVIQPTGKKFKLGMVTIGRWENGVMKEEWLFWDNAAFMKQIGVAP
jgi:hypothetical protein